MRNFCLLAVRLLIITTVICMLAAPNSFATSYNIIDLGVLPGMTDSRAYNINDLGQVVGLSGRHVFLWDSVSGMRDIVQGRIYPDEHPSINDNGQVAGTICSRAFMWSAETGTINLDTLYGEVYDITDDGNVFGVSGNRVFEWCVEGGTVDLGFNVYGYYDICVNEAHQIAGTQLTQFGRLDAFIWDAANGMLDLGEGVALGISNNGKVVGGWRYAFLWDSISGKRWLLPPQYDTRSVGCGVNDLGQVVGQVAYNNKLDQWAFIWEEDTGMRELPSLGGTYGSAQAINNAGIIVGYSSTSDGITHAVLWQPVPEPSSLAVLCLGLLPLMLRRRKR